MHPIGQLAWCPPGGRAAQCGPDDLGVCVGGAQWGQVSLDVGAVGTVVQATFEQDDADRVAHRLRDPEVAHAVASAEGVLVRGQRQARV